MTVTPLPLPSPLPNLFLANWATGRVSMESAFSTDITVSRDTAAEERRQLVDRPYRTLTVQFTELTQAQATKLWMNVIRIADERLPLPLYQDKATTSLSSTGRFINVSTANRRLFPGARVVIFDFDSDGQPNQVEYRTIVAVNPNDIDLGGIAGDQLQNTYAAGSHVYPVMDIEIDLDSSPGELVTDGKLAVALQAKEVTGPSALDPVAVGLPSGFPVYLGLPILNISPDWRTAVGSRVVRPGKSYGQGRGVVVNPRASRPRLAYNLQMLQLNRADAWDVIGFFESRAGRAKPFWMLAPQSLFTPVGISITAVDVQAVGNLEDVQSFLAFVGIEETDGTLIVRGISSITDQGGGVWRIAFNLAIVAPALSDIKLVTSAHKVRLNKDALSEVWLTLEHCQYQVEAIDLLAEAVATVTNATPPLFSQGDIEDIPDLYAWFSAQGNAWVDPPAPVSVDPEERTVPYPLDQAGESSRIDFLFDCRRAPLDNSLTEPYLLTKPAAGGPDRTPISAYFLLNRYNHGLRTNYHFGITTTSGWGLENSQGLFWDNTDGLTVFVCARFGGPTTVHRHLVRDGVFEWQNGTVKFFAVADTEVPSATISYVEPVDSTLIIMAVRWDPGVSAEIFFGGGAALSSAATPAASIDTVARDTDVLLYSTNSFGGGNGAPQQINFNLDRQSMSNDILIFDRALTPAEMNTVGQKLADMYAIAWDTIP